MKFTTATVLAAATGVMAGYAHDNVTYTTEVVEVYTTYCPEPTEITHGDKTYTVTEPTTLTITDCPCTISKPVITTSIVECHDCPKPTEEPKPETPVHEEPKPEPPVSEKPKPQPPVSLPVPQPPSNATSTLETYYPTGAPSATEEPSEVPTAGAGKAAAFSGLGLAGVLGLAVFAL